MQYRMAGLLFFLLVAGAGMVACSGGASSPNGVLPPPGQGTGGSGSASPIKHVIVVIQENRSFDNLFATFPGANGATSGLAEPMPSSIATACANYGWPVIATATSVPLQKVDLFGNGFPKSYTNFANTDLAHAYRGGYLVDCDSAAGQPKDSSPCKMDGYDLTFSNANGTGGHPMCTYPYQYVDPNDIQPYWQMAQQYVLADDAFQTQGSESFTAHQQLIAGGTQIDSKDSIIDDPSYAPWGCDGNSTSEVTNLITIYGQYEAYKGPFPCFTYSTVRDELDAKSITWKYYSCKVYSKGPNRFGPGIWSAFDAIKAVRYSKEWGTKVTFNPAKIFSDIQHNRLPAVAWVTPDAVNSDHPQENKDLGPAWVASIVNAVGESKYWKSSAVVVLWDDAGGFYDHVSPPFYDTQGGLGFRFPMIIISPYVAAHVEHTQYETASVLRFIEDNWGLNQLGQEDSRATGIENAFNFKQKPRSFKPITSELGPAFFMHQKPSGLPPDTD